MCVADVPVSHGMSNVMLVHEDVHQPQKMRVAHSLGLVEKVLDLSFGINNISICKPNETNQTIR
jgi:hypothetical protein